MPGRHLRPLLLDHLRVLTLVVLALVVMGSWAIGGPGRTAQRMAQPGGDPGMSAVAVHSPVSGDPCPARPSVTAESCDGEGEGEEGARAGSAGVDDRSLPMRAFALEIRAPRAAPEPRRARLLVVRSGRGPPSGPRGSAEIEA